MTTKTIKTILLATIMLSIVIPITGFSLAEAKTMPDAIPEDELLQRGNSWIAKYSSAEEFEQSQNAINAYVNDVHPDNAWNKQTKKNQIILYNFDTLADAPGAGLSALLADVEIQKDSGKYNPTDAEGKFHNWAAQQITNEVTSDVPQGQINKVIKAWNSNANYGNVPTVLFESDLGYWLDIASEKRCSLDAQCEKNRSNAVNPDLESYGLIQFAYATTWNTYHEFDTWVEAYSCDTGDCKYTDDDSGVGVLNTYQEGSSNHSTHKTISWYMKDKTFVNPTYSSNLEISGTVQRDSQTHDVGPYYGSDELIKSSAYWFSANCGSGNACGTYSFTAQAENATFDT